MMILAIVELCMALCDGIVDSRSAAQRTQIVYGTNHIILTLSV